jgi:hypothetical protein
MREIEMNVRELRAGRKARFAVTIGGKRERGRLLRDCSS